MRSLALLAPVVLLAACGQTETTPAANTAAPVETGYIAKVQALPAGQLEGVLFRAIQDGPGGQGCQGVRQIETRPPTKTGDPVWRVTCVDDSQWAVSLADNGIATVTGARS